MGQLAEAASMAEGAYGLASGHGLTALAQQIKPVLDGLRNS